MLFGKKLASLWCDVCVIIALLERMELRHTTYTLGNLPLETSFIDDYDVTENLAIHEVKERETFFMYTKEQVTTSDLVSIVIIAHNEHQYIMKTLSSIVDSTDSRQLLEIIVVDDGSHPPLSIDYSYVTSRQIGIRSYRNKIRKGICSSRVRGGQNAAGSILVFMDAHMSVRPGWLLPLIEQVSSNKKRVAVPSIYVLDDTWAPQHATIGGFGNKMMFDWSLRSFWYDDGTPVIPVMPGGVFAISRYFWLLLEKLDSKMEGWGAENIEQSLRIWLCGGEIVTARKSLVGHVFKESFHYPVSQEALLNNKIKVAETWLGGYKQRFYDAVPLAKYKARREILKGEEWRHKSTSEQFKEELGCTDFLWFIEFFKEVFLSQGLLEFDSFIIKHKESDTCAQVKQNSASRGFIIHGVACQESNALQHFIWLARKKMLYSKGLKMCLCVHPRHGPKQFQMAYFERCDRRNPQQKFQYKEGRLIGLNSVCLSAAVNFKYNLPGNSAAATNATVTPLGFYPCNSDPCKMKAHPIYADDVSRTGVCYNLPLFKTRKSVESSRLFHNYTASPSCEGLSQSFVLLEGLKI